MLYDHVEVEDGRILELHKCPFCYGHSLCNDLLYKGTKLNRYNIGFEDSLLNTYFLQNILNIKNVFFALDSYSGQKMVIKKLAHSSELDEFDQNEKMCVKNENSCLNKAIKLYGEIIKRKFNQKSFQTLSNFLGIDFGRCFSSRLIDLMYKGYFLTYSKSMENLEDFYDHNLALLTILKINPEPIVLQILPKKDGWPFPEFFGSCGRIIVESLEDKTIDQYYNSPFQMRIKIAKRLLEAIKELEYNKFDIGVYLLDLGLENISYDEQNDKIYFIDAENVFLVDKLKIKAEHGEDFENLLNSDFEECGQYGDCLSFNLDKMCESTQVDLNIYSGLVS
ncbi:deleted in autism 1 [Brachionus plicatilis]|uniref:Deleted in autism 1 n=1 Tax=Brachionus plicatilis TaxID=10195 RepID=A0A3M7R0P4_BRAPC|nr:deleted in autism 1 [Brachionus plicatilis]